jgi:hypothetical protein
LARTVSSSVVTGGPGGARHRDDHLVNRFPLRDIVDAGEGTEYREIPKTQALLRRVVIHESDRHET